MSQITISTAILQEMYKMSRKPVMSKTKQILGIITAIFFLTSCATTLPSQDEKQQVSLQLVDVFYFKGNDATSITFAVREEMLAYLNSRADQDLPQKLIKDGVTNPVTIKQFIFIIKEGNKTYLTQFFDPDMARRYAANFLAKEFSLSELKEIMAFYSSPVGQKFATGAENYSKGTMPPAGVFTPEELQVIAQFISSPTWVKFSRKGKVEELAKYLQSTMVEIMLSPEESVKRKRIFTEKGVEICGEHLQKCPGIVL